jgi:DNA polymerase III delta prime subunit
MNDISNNSTIPWVEKYRPTNFNDIVLDDTNRQIFENILNKNYFPNLLFYGPPGTGKTTTIINLIHAYQTRFNEVTRGTIIHLNASDERGIDIIRNQIYQFARSKNLFENGLKFIILDEVDYMTKNAQQALKYLLQTSSQNVRFCLICNYISKIDESLKNEFISIRFNQLPIKYIYEFIRKVSISENIELSDSVIATIQTLYQSDIRSMINFIQLHQNIRDWERIIITNDIYEKIHEYLRDSTPPISRIIQYVFEISKQYNTDKRHIIVGYCHFIIKNKPEIIHSQILSLMETVIHTVDTDIQQLLSYFFCNMRDFLHLFSFKTPIFTSYEMKSLINNSS